MKGAIQLTSDSITKDMWLSGQSLQISPFSHKLRSINLFANITSFFI